MPRGGFRPGAGRKDGTKNKRTKEIGELLDSLNCDPISGMVQIAQNKKIEVGIRARMYAELAGYRYPKRKAVEHTGPAGEPVSLRIKIDWVDPPTG